MRSFNIRIRAIFLGPLRSATSHVPHLAAGHAFNIAWYRFDAVHFPPQTRFYDVSRVDQIFGDAVITLIPRNSELPDQLVRRIADAEGRVEIIRSVL